MKPDSHCRRAMELLADEIRAHETPVASAGAFVAARASAPEVAVGSHAAAALLREAAAAMERHGKLPQR